MLLGKCWMPKAGIKQRLRRAGAMRMPAAEGEAALQPGQAAAAPARPARRDRRQQRRAAPGLRLQVPPAKGAPPVTGRPPCSGAAIGCTPDMRHVTGYPPCSARVPAISQHQRRQGSGALSQIPTNPTRTALIRKTGTPRCHGSSSSSHTPGTKLLPGVEIHSAGEQRGGF